MQLMVVGANHRSAPLEVRERLAFREESLPPALAALRGYAQEGFILSTCNRTEIYALVAHPGPGERSLKRFLLDFHGLSPEGMISHLYTYLQTDAARHLLAVAAGLDSMVLGETQILGQVRVALELAKGEGTLGPVFSALGRHALRVGKTARRGTLFGKNPVSVPAVAVELGKRIFYDLRSRTVLVIGGGEMAQLTLRSLLRHGAGLLVLNRTYERAVELARTYGGKALPFDALREALAQADIVISSTDAPGYVIRPPAVEAALASRDGRPLCLIDIAVPRDVDPGVSGWSQVFLYNIDDLEEICAAHQQEQEQAAHQVEQMVAAEASRFMSWWASREVVPTIKALRRRAEEIRIAELQRTLGRLKGLTQGEREAIAAMTSAMVKKLLHQPITHLKASNDGGSSARAVQRLFQLPGDGATAPGEEKPDAGVRGGLPGQPLGSGTGPTDSGAPGEAPAPGSIPPEDHQH